MQCEDDPGEQLVRIICMAKAVETKIDTHQALLAVNAVLTNGRSSPDGTSWHGLTVNSDLDGYTVTLSDDKVELRLLFHNKFQLKCPNRYAQIAFIEKLNQVVRASKSSPS